MVRTLRKALRPGYMTHGKTPSSFWRKALHHFHKTDFLVAVPTMSKSSHIARVSKVPNI